MRKNIALIALLCALVMALAGCFAEETVAVPQLNTARRPVPDNEAMAFLKAMGVGWNLGNTFDAIGKNLRGSREMDLETYWCGVKTNEKMFDALKAAGYGCVRIPVSWSDHVSGDDFTISSRWLDRVQEVVGWALERGFHVILNIHHDEYEFYPSSDRYESSSRYISSIWSQLAERFRDCDEHLIFESMNEPRLIGTGYEWVFNKTVPDCVDAAECLNKLNQLFVDTVRASGGNNASRYLMVPGYDAAPDGALNDFFRLPEDSADNRIIVSVHAYTPYPFALQDGGTKEFNLNYQAQLQEIVSFMNLLYGRYIVNGIPVVIGEFGARDKDNLQARVDFTAFYTATASARNMPCLWWDNGAFKGNGELFGVLDRRAGTFSYPQIVEAMITYGGYDKLPDPQ